MILVWKKMPVVSALLGEQWDQVTRHAIANTECSHIKGKASHKIVSDGMRPCRGYLGPIS